MDDPEVVESLGDLGGNSGGAGDDDDDGDAQDFMQDFQKFDTFLSKQGIVTERLDLSEAPPEPEEVPAAQSQPPPRPLSQASQEPAGEGHPSPVVTLPRLLLGRPSLATILSWLEVD
jgi:hypothetical protein